MGIFYLGLLPSFWVRLRAAPDLPAITATIPDWLAGASFSPGALAKWWICLAIVSSDVGAYFGGKV
jgi:CDP-diglyceride synthetase